MRMFGTIVLLSLLVLPTVCFGLLYSVEGNQPQAEANYKQWPKLVEVVNDASRTRLVWCNGDETLYYRGKTEVLNRLLQKFAQVEVDELRVVLRPELKEPQNYQAHLRVIGGIALAGLEEDEDDTPTLTIYLTENVRLKDLAVPANLVVESLADVRKRHADLEKKGSRYAARIVQTLDADADRPGKAAKRYADDIQAIEAWIQARKGKQVLKP